ncbi:hypothetical protein M899_2986 [Bacteriovorax sp. BSW11_IV]|uniref:flagellar biosynthetic protein FliO n=1 Tax=Bacteriovorax sp. BSW11_IV TaxID=1353529 RepID=UPI000389EFA8|nr:flagellar biosynthetic protein FliO [Bacteriovorax sp. BSW11_IV]EQC48930.1 hypothetical protein M899_2986 [Bacteriovorax sp. BSW11_IV]
MKALLKFFIATLFVSMTFANEQVQISNLDFKKEVANKALIKIKVNAPMKETPELVIKDNIVQVVMPNTIVWPKIEKKVTVNTNYDTTLMAYQFNKELVRVRAILPYSLKGMENKVSLTLNNDEVELTVPTVGGNSKPVVTVKNEEKVTAEKFDESYLDKLVQDKSSRTLNDEVVQAQKNDVKEEVKEQKIDMINTKMSALEKNDEKPAGFSMTSYLSKVVAFLAILILGFYAVMNLMRKGVLKKSKLGFLNSEKMVEVLNTTYVGPKRSVLMIKAHNQVFLVGSSEAGLQPLGEINDVTGLLKEGEKRVGGDNFDTNLVSANSANKEFKLKEVVNTENNTQTESEQGESLANFLQNNPVPDKVKLSDQIKNKVKGMKSLQ